MTPTVIWRLEREDGAGPWWSCNIPCFGTDVLSDLIEATGKDFWSMEPEERRELVCGCADLRQFHQWFSWDIAEFRKDLVVRCYYAPAYHGKEQVAFRRKGAKLLSETRLPFPWPWLWDLLEDEEPVRQNAATC